MATKVFMDFDFIAGNACLTGMTDKPIIKNISELCSYTDTWNVNYYFELPMGDNGEKWTFTWGQWAKKEQYFKLEQYVPFPKTPKLIQPVKYNPWSKLAYWSYISNPNLGTSQTDTVYCNQYNHELIRKYNIVFSVKGEPSIKNWTTKNIQL